MNDIKKDNIPEHLRIEIEAVAVQQAAKQLIKDGFHKDPFELFKGSDRLVDWLYLGMTDAEAKEFTAKWAEKVGDDLLVPDVAAIAAERLSEDEIKELAQECGFWVLSTDEEIIELVTREFNEDERQALIDKWKF